MSSQKCSCNRAKSLNSNIKMEILGKLKNIHGAVSPIRGLATWKRSHLRVATGVQRIEVVFSKGTKGVMAWLPYKTIPKDNSGHRSCCLRDAPVDQTCSAANSDMCQVSTLSSLIGTSLLPSNAFEILTLHGHGAW